LGSFSISINELSGAVELASFKADTLLADVLGVSSSEQSNGSGSFTLCNTLGAQWLLGRLEKARTPEDFQAELQDAVRSIVKARSIEARPLSGDHASRSSYYGDILNSDADTDITISKHLEALGLEHLTHISSDMRTATLRLVDRKRREHLIEVSFPRGYPALPPSVVVALPRPLPLVWGHRHRGADGSNRGLVASDLKGVLRCVQTEIKKYEGVIDVRCILSA
jgi:hypothetical protein